MLNDGRHPRYWGPPGEHRLGLSVGWRGRPYGFAEGNPVAGRDPSGQETLIELIRGPLPSVGLIGVGLGLNEVAIGMALADRLCRGECIYVKTRFCHLLDYMLSPLLGEREVYTEYCRNDDGTMRDLRHVVVAASGGTVA